MVGLACPFTMNGPPLCWYGGPLAQQMIVLVWLAHRPQCRWPYMPIETAHPACPLRWWLLAPNHSHHLRPTTLMVVHYVMCDGWPIWSPMMVGPSGPLWLAPRAHYNGWLCGPVMAAGINGCVWLLLMMVGPLQCLVSRESKHDIKESEGSIYSCYHQKHFLVGLIGQWPLAWA